MSAVLLYLFTCRDDFNIERLREAAQMFVGRHDFRTFMTINNDAHVSIVVCRNHKNFIFIFNAIMV